jgi:tetratricopeptide (TPR) repeat protein
MTSLELLNQATEQRNNGQSEQAIKSYLEAIELFQQENNTTKMAECYQMMGVCYKIENDLKNATAAYMKAVDIYEQLNDQVGMGNTFRDFGLSFVYDKLYTEGLPYLQKSERILRLTSDSGAYGITKVKLGMCMFALGHHKEGEQKVTDGLATIRSAKESKYYNWFMEMTALINLAMLNLHEGDFAGILDSSWAAAGLIYEHGEQDKMSRRLAQIYGCLAYGYLHLKNVDLALTYLKKSLTLLKPLTPAARNVLLEDFRAAEILKLLKQHFPTQYKTLEKEFDLTGFSG